MHMFFNVVPSMIYKVKTIIIMIPHLAVDDYQLAIVEEVCGYLQ